jgi:hypothetical protein
MRVSVDTHERDGTVLASSPPEVAPLSTPVYDALDQSVDAMITDIIHANSHSPADPAR